MKGDICSLKFFPIKLNVASDKKMKKLRGEQKLYRLMGLRGAGNHLSLLP